MPKIPYRVDVLLPFHREDQYLNDAIESLLNSEKVEINLLLLDNRLNKDFFTIKDHLVSCAEERNHTIKIINVFAPNTYAQALNDGLDHVTSDYIALMNSDDLISKERLYLQIETLEQSNSDLSICNFQKFYKSQEISSVSGKIPYEQYSWMLLLLGAYGADATLIFTRKWQTQNNARFPESKQSDWLFALKYYPEANIATLDRKLYFYRMHEKQITRTGSPKFVPKEIVDLIQEKLRFLKIPTGNPKIISALAAPSLKKKLTDQEFKVFMEISINFLNNFSDDYQKNQIKKLLARRIIFALKSIHQLRLINFQWKLAVVLEIWTLAVMFLSRKVRINTLR